MEIEIITKPVAFILHGFSEKVENNDWAGIGRRLMDEMWNEIATRQLKHKGINYWVYEGEDLFVGVELEESENNASLLIKREVSLAKYAYWKHVGAYSKLGEVHRGMWEALKSREMTATKPSVEIYGHWTEDESKLETEVLISVK